jgi:uncharacterized protein (DUF58 family)
MNWKKTATVIILSIIIIIIFLYGYAFLYDYLYAKSFPQISITAYISKFDPTEFSDKTISFVVELANALKEAIS